MYKMFENVFTGIYDIDNKPIHNGMMVLIIDKNIKGTVRYSIRRAGFRIFLGLDKPQNDKTYSIAQCGNQINNNLRIIE
jgi:hypothetical protein